MMKTNKFFGFAAIAFAMAFASCTSESDNPVTPEPEPQPAAPVTISFENAKLNADGYWCGDETGTKTEVFGSEAYECTYTENGATFYATYTPAWNSWSGFAVSNRTATTYAAATMIPDQFNNITGTAKSGSNFCVVYPFLESITFDKPINLKGFYYTNSAWVVDAILNGDGITPGKFEADDFFKFVVYPQPAEEVESGARLEVDLAKDGDYVKEWKYCDVSDLDAFKNIKSIYFGFEGSKKNDFGVVTPSYVCLDDIVFEYAK